MWQNSKAASSFVEHFGMTTIKLDILEKSSHATRYIPVKSYHMISSYDGYTNLNHGAVLIGLILIFKLSEIITQSANDGKHPDLAYKEIARILSEKINGIETSNDKWLVMDNNNKILLLTRNKNIAFVL